MKGSRSATLESVVDDYFTLWNNADPAIRRRALEASCVPDATYMDRQCRVTGYEELETLAAGFHTPYPGQTFRWVGTLDSHHDRARWGWESVAADGSTVVAAGVDFAVLAPEGRLREITGFHLEEC